MKIENKKAVLSVENESRDSKVGPIRVSKNFYGEFQLKVIVFSCLGMVFLQFTI